MVHAQSTAELEPQVTVPADRSTEQTPPATSVTSAAEPVEPIAAAPAPVAQPVVPATATPVFEGDSASAVPTQEAQPDGPKLVLAEEDMEPQSEESAEPKSEPESAGRDYHKRMSILEGGDLLQRISERERGVTLGGYGEHVLQDRQGQNVSFANLRYVLFIYGRLNDRISTSTEVEFEYGGSPLKRNGVLGYGEVLLEFSVLDFEITEWLVLRGGIILMPVSSFNINHDSPTRDLVDRPIGYTTVIPSTWYESGAGMLGTFDLPGDMTLNYELYAVNGLDSRIADGSGFRAARGSHFEDNNSDKGITARLELRPTLNSAFGLSGYTGEYDKSGHRVNIINGDFRVRLDAFEMLGEAAYVQIDPGYSEGFASSSPANTRTAVPQGMFTYFGQLNYHFRIEPLFRLFPDDMALATFTAVVRYEAMDTDTGYRSAIGDRTRLTLGLNFRPIEQVVIKSDFQWNAHGVDGVRKAPHFFQRAFYEDRVGGFLFDSYVASIAYLF